METTDRSDHLIIKTSKSGTPTKYQLADKLEAQTWVNFSAKTISHLLIERDIKWRKNSKKPFVSEKNRLSRLSFAREHISGNIDEQEWVFSNPIETLSAELENENGLFAVIKNGLQVITEEYLHQLIESMPH